MAGSAKWRRSLGVGAVVAVAGLAAALVARSDPSLADQARQLHQIEPYTIEGMTLRSWTREGAKLRAAYDGEGVRDHFELTLWPTDESAFRWFRQQVEDLTGGEIAGSSVLAGREPCFRQGSTSTCVGYDGYRTFVATARTRPGTTDELDARLLIRAARKHWYRVMGGYVE